MQEYIGMIIAGVGLIVIGIVVWYTIRILDQAESINKYLNDDEDDFWF